MCWNQLRAFWLVHFWWRTPPAGTTLFPQSLQDRAGRHYSHLLRTGYRMLHTNEMSHHSLANNNLSVGVLGLWLQTCLQMWHKCLRGNIYIQYDLTHILLNVHLNRNTCTLFISAVIQPANQVAEAQCIKFYRYWTQIKRQYREKVWS